MGAGDVGLPLPALVHIAEIGESFLLAYTEMSSGEWNRIMDSLSPALISQRSNWRISSIVMDRALA